MNVLNYDIEMPQMNIHEYLIFPVCYLYMQCGTKIWIYISSIPIQRTRTLSALIYVYINLISSLNALRCEKRSINQEDTMWLSTQYKLLRSIPDMLSMQSVIFRRPLRKVIYNINVKGFGYLNIWHFSPFGFVRV